MEKTTQGILFDCAMSLFRAKGYESVSVSQICAKAKVTRNAFYYYYPSKDALLVSYFEKREGFSSKLVRDLLFLQDDWQRICYLFSEHMLQLTSEGISICRAILKTLADGGGEALFEYKLNNEITVPLIRSCQKQGLIHNSKNAEELLLLAIRTMTGLLLTWCGRNGDMDLLAEVHNALNIIMQPTSK